MHPCVCTRGVYTDQGDWRNAIHMGMCPACTANILSKLEARQVFVCAEVSLTNVKFSKTGTRGGTSWVAWESYPRCHA